MILIIRCCQILHMVTDIVGPYVMYVLNLTIAQNTLLLLIARIWGQNSTPMLKYKLQILNLNMFRPSETTTDRTIKKVSEAVVFLCV